MENQTSLNLLIPVLGLIGFTGIIYALSEKKEMADRLIILIGAGASFASLLIVLGGLRR